MSNVKTIANDASVETFLNALKDEQRRQDCFQLVNLMRAVTQAEPTMWGSSIVGFGNYHYVYESGRAGDSFLIGFAPRKQDISVYGIGRFAGSEALFEHLGKHKTGKACVYIKKLADINQAVLTQLLEQSVAHTQALYPEQQTN